MPDRGRWTQHAALVALLDDIAGGADYHTNLEGRVYSRLVVPGDQAGITLPFLCVPVDAAATVQESEGGWASWSYAVTIHGFVDDPSSDSLAGTEGAKAAAQLLDDVVKKCLANPTISGTCSASSIVGWEIWGPTSDAPYGEIQVRLAVQVTASGESLGP